MSGAGEIVHIDPAAALPGGAVLIECRAYDTSSLNECQVLFGEMRARLVGASPARAQRPALAERHRTTDESGNRGEGVATMVKGISLNGGTPNVLADMEEKTSVPDSMASATRA